MGKKKRTKLVGNMKLPELLDELIECAKLQDSGAIVSLFYRVDRRKYNERQDYLAKRIDECRDEIARRVGN